MSDQEEVTLNGIRISDLPVKKIRLELGKRGFRKTGLKENVVARLTAALIDERDREELKQLLNNTNKEKKKSGPKDTLTSNDEVVPTSPTPGPASANLNDTDTTIDNDAVSVVNKVIDKAAEVVEDEDGEELPFITLASNIFESSAESTGSESEGVFRVSSVISVVPGIGFGFAGNVEKDVEGGDSRSTALANVDEESQSRIDYEQEFSSHGLKIKSPDIIKVESPVHGSNEIATAGQILDQTQETTVEETTVEETTVANALAGDESQTGPGVAETGSLVEELQTVDNKTTEQKNNEEASTNSQVQTLIVSGFSSTTRASDIRQAFRDFGKIYGVKIISNSREEGSGRFAHVTISTSDNAEECIQKLNNSEMYGSVVLVARVEGNALDFVKELVKRKNSTEAVSENTIATAVAATNQPETCGEDQTNKNHENENKDVEVLEDSKDEDIVVIDGNEEATTETAAAEKIPPHVEKLEPKVVSVEQKSEKGSARASSSSKRDSKQRDESSRHKSDKRSSRDERPRRPDAARRPGEVRLRSPNFRPYEGGRKYYSMHSGTGRPVRGPPYGPDKSDRLTFDKIRRNREDAMRREHERRKREYELRKQREEEERQRAFKRQNERLLREVEEGREKLRREREALERDKQEVLRLEKIRQQQERERIEKEKEELRRAQLKLAQKRTLGKEKDRGRQDEYPDAKRSHLEGHRIAPSSHSQPEFSRRSDPRNAESSRRVESGRHDRDRVGLRVEVGFDERSRARPREKDHGRRSSSRDKRPEQRARDKVPEYAPPRAPKPPIISNPIERVSRDYQPKEYSAHGAHGSGSRSDTHRAADVPAEPWGRSSYSASTSQAGGRTSWPGGARKPAALASNDRQVRVEPAMDRWGATSAPSSGFGSRGSPSLLNHQVPNPHAGHMNIGGALPGNSSGLNQYKGPPGQYRRY